MQEVKKFIIEVAAEVLPRNEKTEIIMAQRAAADEARLLKLEEVRTA